MAEQKKSSAAPKNKAEPKADRPDRAPEALDASGVDAGSTTGSGDNEVHDLSSKVPRVEIAENKEALVKLAKSLRKKSSAKTILVPVDFSPHSEAALEFAADLAEKMPAHLIILHVVHDPGEMPGYYAKLVKKKRVGRIQDIAREVFDDFLRQFIDTHPQLKPVRKAGNLMIIGLPVTRILQVIEKLNPTLVVMGSQGRTGLKHLLLGSKAEQVVQLSPVPVTIVKKKSTES